MSSEKMENTCKKIWGCMAVLRSFGSALRRFGFTTKDEIKIDLTDKNTFYAWQRNHMANERTFLAWCRTGISLIAFGFVIERFDILIREMHITLPRIQAPPATIPPEKFLPEAPLVTPFFPDSLMPGTHVMGIVALGLGMMIIVLAGWRFYYIRNHINRADTDFSILPDTFLLSSVLLMVASAFVFFAFYF
ncbi:MAG: DUF202 domain-containing protein [Desulfobacteraceae bacterium]|nr:DUF202 domain-containing protein [Desulfobacteraceae bacterium]